MCPLCTERYHPDQLLVVGTPGLGHRHVGRGRRINRTGTSGLPSLNVLLPLVRAHSALTAECNTSKP